MELLSIILYYNIVRVIAIGGVLSLLFALASIFFEG